MNNDFDFDVDGMNMLDVLMMSSVKDETTKKVAKIFKKYGLSLTKGMAMLLEISVVLGGKK